jgi:hypothetical protein
MIHFVPTVVFDFPFTVNKLPLEVDLVGALLPQVHLAPCRRRVPVEQARRAAKFDTIVAPRYD